MNKSVKEILISEEQIIERSKVLGAQITRDYAKYANPPLLVALLKGSVPFLAELIKHIDLDIEFEFMDVSTYEGVESTGSIKINKDLDCPIVGRDIILVEDIVDTGFTLKNVKEMLYNKGARSVKIVTMLDKKENRLVPIEAEYVGFEIPNAFVIGFGLDFNQKFRNLPYIGILKEEYYK